MVALATGLPAGSTTRPERVRPASAGGSCGFSFGFSSFAGWPFWGACPPAAGQAVHQTRHVRHARDQPFGDVQAGQAHSADVAQDAQHAVLRRGEVVLVEQADEFPLDVVLGARQVDERFLLEVRARSRLAAGHDPPPSQAVEPLYVATRKPSSTPLASPLPLLVKLA